MMENAHLMSENLELAAETAAIRRIALRQGMIIDEADIQTLTSTMKAAYEVAERLNVGLPVDMGAYQIVREGRGQ